MFPLGPPGDLLASVGLLVGSSFLESTVTSANMHDFTSRSLVTSASSSSERGSFIYLYSGPCSGPLFAVHFLFTVSLRALHGSVSRGSSLPSSGNALPQLSLARHIGCDHYLRKVFVRKVGKRKILEVSILLSSALQYFVALGPRRFDRFGQHLAQLLLFLVKGSTQARQILEGMSHSVSFQTTPHKAALQHFWRTRDS